VSTTGSLSPAVFWLGCPGKETAHAFRDCVVGFGDWGLTNRQAFARFIIENEWNWREGPPPLSDG
jgi:hypothetical protein